MGKKYQLNGEVFDNVYFYTRMKAAQEKTDLKIREKASVLLKISCESLKSYEYGKTPVPARYVLAMCEAYEDPQLFKEHCRFHCPLGQIFFDKFDSLDIEIQHLEIDRLTLQLLNSFRKISSIKDSLVEIVADGKITEAERPQLNEILETLDSISLHTQELRFWVNRNLKDINAQ